MLDGLLGKSGFYTKSKSLIKQTRTRIDVVRRKRCARQKFLKKDIADLLANGFEANAFGRAEGLVAELTLSSCYDFIDHVCEIILKHLPVLQKLRECPEDCREAVASVMFAAARFSDLPELRDLRNVFQERYGSSLEHFVNQKLVENITPKPPSKEKKVQLMQQIAVEFSIPWESRGLEERISNSSAADQNKKRSPTTIHATADKVGRPFAEENVQKTVKDEVFANNRSEATYRNKEREVNDWHQMEPLKEALLGRRHELKHNPETHKPPSVREEPIQKREDKETIFQRREPKAHLNDFKGNRVLESVQNGTPSNGKELQSVHSQPRVDRQREEKTPERDLVKILSHRQDPFPVNKGTISSSNLNNELAEDIERRSMRKRPEDVKDGSKLSFRSAIPPPYVKPSKNKHRADLDSKQAHLDSFAEENDTLTFKSVSNDTKKSGGSLTKSNNPDHQNGVNVLENGDGQGGHFTEIYYKDEFTPRRRSHRKKHSRSKSDLDNKLDSEVGGREEERVVRRVSTSRRKHEQRKGLQILFDDEHFKRDDEERMIDKLLLHYSKKPSSSDPRNPRRKTKNEPNDARKFTSHHTTEDGSREHEDSKPSTSRSMSFPPRLVTQTEPKKVFTRAASFQQDDNPAKHVHPKLPDYDDLAARFAALRSSKD